ncbi:hypothetical protein CISG_02391 [Coccidioides immitis RMSCC 3703]|uniref:DUF7907 domain-containing protein n=2 Tax=Coccidioides immitis TaxID=5501 RepID=A0A0J8R7Y4_COCIT|nr:hypothetical protein CIRG_05937 [Coccidioides immitis RMSCC 2394]KMU80540.1 hypothetical protein CISG_02391 [Coccidioides immitis RMSCC 3703]
MFAQIFLLLILSMLSAALPAPEGAREYYIRDSNGQYLSSYHIQAGASDAVLVPDVERASKGFLSGSNQMISSESEISWGMVLNAPKYSQWANVQIRAGDTTDGFFLDGDRLLWRDDDEFRGWLVCDWWHGLPQLFWVPSARNETSYPSSCWMTDLRVENV